MDDVFSQQLVELKAIRETLATANVVHGPTPAPAQPAQPAQVAQPQQPTQQLASVVQPPQAQPPVQPPKAPAQQVQPPTQATKQDKKKETSIWQDLKQLLGKPFGSLISKGENAYTTTANILSKTLGVKSEGIGKLFERIGLKSPQLATATPGSTVSSVASGGVRGVGSAFAPVQAVGGAAGASGAGGAGAVGAGAVPPVISGVGAAGSGASGAGGVAAAGAGSAIAMVAVIAAIVAVVVAAIALLIKGILSWTKSIIESQKHLAEYNGLLAHAYAISNVRQIKRDIASGQQTGESTAALISAFDDLKDTWRPIGDAITNLINKVLTWLLRIFNAISEWIVVPLEAIAEWCGLIEKNTKKVDVGLPAEGFFRDINNGDFAKRQDRQFVQYITSAVERRKEQLKDEKVKGRR